MKNGGQLQVHVAIEPPLRSYDDVKPRLLEMKAISQEGLGMVTLASITFAINHSPTSAQDQSPTYHRFRLPLQRHARLRNTRPVVYRVSLSRSRADYIPLLGSRTIGHDISLCFCRGPRCILLCSRNTRPRELLYVLSLPEASLSIYDHGM